ncbi:unnamed protein product [Rhizoctonia solani]|uniref:Uncharacterized protein n=1 Tax=Rhizoctonia solani TaxID=456999 RepID=A0A8H3B838_9AGAM|nr:unnamed protein product [Rhizoctonia solani]
MRLDYVLTLTEDFLGRGLQALVFKSGLAKLIHHARVLIRQRYIRVVPGKQIVNFPYFIARLDSRKHIDFALIPLTVKAATDIGDEEDEE